MNRCPITYEDCGEARYSMKGLRKLSRSLSRLKTFPYTAERQRQEAVIRAGKMSIQGIQPKLSARLNASAASFEVVDKGGRYILKPQHVTYPELPENEDMTMRLAELVGIDVPLHGMIYSEDGSLTYFIRRFDRVGRNLKLALEDFAQLAQKDRETKYRFSMEKLVPLLDYCTFPMVERAELLKRCLFNYLVGNEDMHLKNYSLISRDGETKLSPAYDFLNTAATFLALGKPFDDIEEVALPLKGKKRGLTRSLWIDYFAHERLEMNDVIIGDLLRELADVLPALDAMLSRSFLSSRLVDLYRQVLEHRAGVLGLA